ncbi:DUF6702 family protein [Owenweeksia hongkongensis]|uniref:DUF6702 family protein n=1 Tax=Owenweeksia hongkongensis TaxID=253245 RepID=UPI003A95CEA7
MKWIIGLLLMIGMQSAWAHQPSVSSTILSQQGDQSWVLQVRSPLSAFEYEIKQLHGETSFSTPEEFKSLVLNHILKNVTIQVNGENTVQLIKGFVKLGHETNVVFQATGIPEEIESIDVSNKSFEHIGHNQSALMIIKSGLEKQQFVLDNTNQHSIKLLTEGNRLVEQTANSTAGIGFAPTSFMNYVTWGLGLLFILLFGFYLYQSNKLDEATRQGNCL